MNRLIITIKGRVQGVGFRYATHDAAYELGIRGTVRNLPDGSVEIDAEGEERTLENFIEWCKQGPSRAVVSSLTKIEFPIKGYKDFTIK